MLVDLVAILLGQGAAADGQVVQLAAVVQQLRHVHLEAPAIVRRHDLGTCAGDAVLRAIRQQRLLDRQRCWRCLHPRQLIARQAQPIIQRPLPAPRTDAAQAILLFGRQEFAADVAARDEREFLVQRLQQGITLLRQRWLAAAFGHAFPVIDPDIAFEHFETGAHLVDAVVDGLELGRLVDDVFGRGHLAAIVQPRRQVQLLPALVAQRKLRKRATILRAGSTRQHEGELGHARTMTAGVRALVVDGSGDHADGCFQQRLLFLHQLLRLQRGRRARGQRLDEADTGFVDRLVLEQQQHAQQLVVAIAQRQRQHGRTRERLIQAKRTQFLHGQVSAQGSRRLAGGFQQLGQAIRRQRRQLRRGLGPPALDIQRSDTQRAAGIGKVERTATRAGDVDQLVQQPRPQLLEIGLGHQLLVDPQEPPHRIAHQVEGRTEGVDLAHRGTHHRMIGEIEPTHRFGFLRKPRKRCHDAAGNQQGDHRRNRHQQEKFTFPGNRIAEPSQRLAGDDDQHHRQQGDVQVQGKTDLLARHHMAPESSSTASVARGSGKVANSTHDGPIRQPPWALQNCLFPEAPEIATDMRTKKNRTRARFQRCCRNQQCLAIPMVCAQRGTRTPTT